MTTGRLEVICGSMFSGKTEELIRRVRRCMIAKQSVMVFKPALDTRYGIDRITTHGGQSLEAKPILSPVNLYRDAQIIAIDEAQFFDEYIVHAIKTLYLSGTRVIVAGLDTDFRGEPFGAMPQLLALADEVTKLHAVCDVCGNEARHTQRLINGHPAPYNSPLILLGAEESYTARCRDHFLCEKD